MEEYLNEVEKDYKICEKINLSLLMIYIINFLLSFLLLFFESNIIVNILIVTHIIYFIISSINDMILFNFAESERLKTNISNAYDIDISMKKTIGYYNNDEHKNGINKFGINCFESVFHSKSISKIMLSSETIKIVISSILWLIIILNFNDKNFILCITQTLFSGELLNNYLKLIYYNYKNNLIFNNFYSIFVTSKYSTKKEPLLLNYIIEYESTKRYSHILLSSSIFNKNKEKLTNEWEEIKNKIQ